jgi:hypothetical protein
MRKNKQDMRRQAKKEAIMQEETHRPKVDPKSLMMVEGRTEPVHERLHKIHRERIERI